MKVISIAEVDNVKNKRQFMARHILVAMKNDAPSVIVDTLLSFMSADDLEDAFCTICDVER